MPTTTWFSPAVHVAFVIDLFARRIVGWHATTSGRSDLAIDAREQALYDRELDGPRVHHGVHGVQYLPTRYTERLGEAGIEASVGSRGDSDNNALAETVIKLYKTEVIRPAGPRRGRGTQFTEPPGNPERFSFLEAAVWAPHP